MRIRPLWSFWERAYFYNITRPHTYQERCMSQQIGWKCSKSPHASLSRSSGLDFIGSNLDVIPEGAFCWPAQCHWLWTDAAKILIRWLIVRRRLEAAFLGKSIARLTTDLNLPLGLFYQTKNLMKCFGSLECVAISRAHKTNGSSHLSTCESYLTVGIIWKFCLVAQWCSG